MGNPFKDFKYYPTEMKVGCIAGVVLTILVVSLLILNIVFANPWVPKPIKLESEIITVKVCGPSTALLKEAAEHQPGCLFDFVDSTSCDAFGHENEFTVVYGDPTRGGQSDAGASVVPYMKEIEGWYLSPDRGDGKPGWVPVGTASGARLTLKPGEKDDLVIGHELGHVCGRWHAFMARWMKRWSLYQNLHVLSPSTRTLGEDTRGLGPENGATYYEPELIDVKGSKKPEDP